MAKAITRRQVLAGLAAAAAKLGISALTGCAPQAKSLADDALDPGAYLPLVSNMPTPPPTATSTPTPTPTATPTSTPTPTATPTPTCTPGTGLTGRVVHVHAVEATSWDFSTGWYGDYVNQDVVNAMVDEGLKLLTGQVTVAAAWQSLLPDYTPGKAIAIKVNFNNSSCTDTDNIIDALIEPVNALVRGLKSFGVREEDVWVYDALRRIPDRYYTRCAYSGVRFFDSGTCAGVEVAGFTNTDPDAEIIFGNPNLTSRRITDVLTNASYLINMPIMKDHAISGVTLGFKNHFGSIDRIVRLGEDNLHLYICPTDSHYDPGYSALVELNASPHIRAKTVLILGDGLFGSLVNTNLQPTRWETFGDAAPNSLFFSTDPVAVDCVMLDFLDAEPVYHYRPPGTDDYLQLGAGMALGVFERGDPWGSGYDRIVYTKATL